MVGKTLIDWVNSEQVCINDKYIGLNIFSKVCSKLKAKI